MKEVNIKLEQLKALESLVNMTRFYLMRMYKNEELEKKFEEMYNYVDIIKQGLFNNNNTNIKK